MTRARDRVIDPSELAEDARDRSLHRARIRGVRYERQHPRRGTRRARRTSRFGEGRIVTAEDREVRALAREVDRDRAADTAARNP